MNILIKNGTVYNGTNDAPTIQDIYIENNIIKQIGLNLNLGNMKNIQNLKVIDCTNLVVAPGFIDAHSHNDFKVNNDNAILPFLRQGITTQVVGNCGFSAYGVNEKSTYKKEIGSGLFKWENPKSLNEYRNDFNGKILLNLVPLIGHGSVRISSNGLSPKVLSSDEMKEMLDLTRTAMEEGAFGGSLGLMYQPSMFAPKEELIEFAKVINEYNGIMTVHPRACSKVALGYPLIGGKPHIEQGLDEVIDIMKASHVNCEYSHLIFVGKSSWKCVNPMLKAIKKVNNEGYQLGFDMYPFTYGASVITVVLPSWYLKLTPEVRRKPFTRLKLKLIINITKKLLGINFSDMVISYVGESYGDYEGLTIAEVAKKEQKSEFDTYLKLVDISNGKARIMIDKYYNEEIIKQLMNEDLSIYMTDAWYEEQGAQNASTYQAFPFFLIKTKKYGIDLQTTIHKMTGAIADRFQIPNRGFIKEGYAADITIFNYDKVQINEKIPNTNPIGIEYVIVNGDIVINQNQYTGKKNGQVLKKEVLH